MPDPLKHLLRKRKILTWQANNASRNDLEPGNETMTTATQIKVTARAKAFSGRGVQLCRFAIDTDGTVRVYDSVAGHYTVCHCLSQSAQRRIRKLAAAQ